MTDASSRSSGRFGLILLLGALAALGPFAIDTYLPAFPVMAREFGTDASRVGLSLSAYFFGICLGQLAYGPILDRLGRRGPLLVGLGLFAASSLLCAFVSHLDGLIGLRFLQALGGCAGMVAGRTLVRDLFPDDAARIFSSLMLVMGIAPVIAPSLGGLLSDVLGWRSIFLFLAAISVVVLVFIAWKLPSSHRPDPSVSLHPLQVAKGYGEILRHPDFLAYGLGGSLVSAGLFAYIAGSPAVYIQVLGFTRQQFGWIFAINALGLVGASQVNGLLLSRWSEARIVEATLVVQGIVAVVLAVSAWFGFTAGIVASTWLFLFCQGIVMPDLNALSMQPFRGNAGRASALVGSMGMAFGALLSGLVSVLPAGTAMPMATGVAVASLGGMAVLRLVAAVRPMPT